MLQGFMDDAMSYLGEMITNGVMQLMTFLLGFFPDGDPSINGVIDGFSFTTGSTTFNFLYFVDIGAVLLFIGLAVAIPFVVMAANAAKGTVSIANSALDKMKIRIGR